MGNRQSVILMVVLVFRNSVSLSLSRFQEFRRPSDTKSSVRLYAIQCVTAFLRVFVCVIRDFLLFFLDEVPKIPFTLIARLRNHRFAIRAERQEINIHVK